MIAPAHPPGTNGTAKKSTDPLEYVSASRLKSFLTCRLRFYFEKVLALPRPVAPNLHLGRSVHAALQHYNLARWRGGDTSETAVLAAYAKAFANPEGGAVSFDSPADAEEAESKGASVVSLFLQQQPPNAPRPMGVEVRIEADLPSLALPLLGVIDLVQADRTTVDYKTVGAAPNLAFEAWLHQTQLTAYALLIEDATAEASPGSELVFLVKTKTPRVISHRVAAPGQTERDRFSRLVEAYANGVTNEQYYPSPGMHCAWCDFRGECAGWKGGAT